MTLKVRPAQLKDLAAIEALYRQQVREAERAPLKRQFASSRLWFLLNSTFSAILPITSTADYVYVMQFNGGGKIAHMTKIWNDGIALKQAGWI